jgi:two-component system phosphate regulon sensor histidine kinase PhoR
MQSIHDAPGPEFKNAFVSRVSHELRTPLAGIKAYVELLIDGEARDDKTRNEFYEVIQNEANRLGQLIDDILIISRIEAGIVKSARQPVNLLSVLQAAMTAIAPDAARKNVTLSESCDAGTNQTLGDHDMLYQAVLGLLGNSVKFSPGGSRINVGIATNPHEKTVRIRILDDGPGVEPKDVPGVFDKFSGAQTSARTAGGAGIGLTLVRQIVETVHGGRVFAESRCGSGNCFGLELKLCTPEPNPLPPA